MNKEAIKSALSAIRTGNFLEKSKDLLATIGYQSERTLELSGTVHDFFQEFRLLNPNTKTEQEFRKHAESVKLIFQFTSDEITDDIQQRLFEADGFDKGNIKSFLFCTVELKDNSYSRTKYAEFTREINKRLFAPTVILFRAGDRLTIAFADRRPDKTDEDRDVLGQVTLIKDIRLNNPHRAHLDILSELSLEACADWMDANNKPKNFDGLLSASASAEKLRVVYDNSKLYHNHSAWSFVPWHALAGVRNRSIQKQTRYRDEKKNPDLPNREDLEKISRCFAVKFLIGVMNSSCARDFLRANRRSNLNLYPDDWKKLPIPDVSPEQQTPISALVDKILDAKRSDLKADVSDLEDEVDKLVYELYN